jgi:hypothetical protein
MQRAWRISSVGANLVEFLLLCSAWIRENRDVVGVLDHLLCNSTREKRVVEST